MKDDTISREAAINALGERPVVWSDNDDYTLGERNQYDMDRRAIETVPSVQPSATDTNVATTDTISRAAAVSEIESIVDTMSVCMSMDECKGMRRMKKTVLERIEALPSAQPTGTNTVQVDDCISRQAAIVEIMEDLEDRSLHDDPATPEDYAEGYDEGIRNAAAIVLQMPSAQPGWTPCKTRKPEKSGLYLVTKQQKTGEIQLATAHYNTAFDEWSGNGNFKKVLAWQPLPSPWRGGQ